MKITYYPDNWEDKQYKITGEHTLECNQKFNETRSDKNKFLAEYDNFLNEYYQEFNKAEEYKRNKFIDIAYQILKKKKYEFLKISENKIKSMITNWKNTSQKFNKFLFLIDFKTIDDQNLLQSHIYKILTYKNKRIILECFIWGNDFFINKCRLSKNWCNISYTTRFYTSINYNILWWTYRK